MENEIKVGDYLRTKGGNICKVLQVRKKHRFTTNTGHPSITPERYFVDNIKQYSISKPYVKKHSSNIIDLIEERRLCKWAFSNRHSRRWKWSSIS